MVQKVAINRCFGGFSLSRKAFELLRDMGNEYALDYPDYDNHCRHLDCYCTEIERTDPDLINVLETLGQDASGDLSRVVLVEIPDGVEWEIQEYDGSEWVSEKHRIW